jgi:hypothetical protein
MREASDILIQGKTLFESWQSGDVRVPLLICSETGTMKDQLTEIFARRFFYNK